MPITVVLPASDPRAGDTVGAQAELSAQTSDCTPRFNTLQLKIMTDPDTGELSLEATNFL